MRTLIHVFLPSFVVIRKAEVTERCVVFSQKKEFCPLLPALERFRTPRHSAKFFSKSIQFPERYKCRFELLQYRREAYMLLADNYVPSTTFMVLSSYQSHDCQSSPGSFHECGTAPTGLTSSQLR